MNIEEINHLAKLSGLALDPEQTQQTAQELENILKLVAELQSIDTVGVEPLFHPYALIESLCQPLRADIANETNQRPSHLAVAPSSHDGLYLVPRVLE